MEVKAFAATLGLGLVAGAAAAMMIPKESKIYKSANNAAQMVKEEVVGAVKTLKQH